MTKETTDYFYPNGYWAGYYRFFNPALPNRIGEPLLGHINHGRFKEAIEILSNNQIKYIEIDKKEMICCPTEEAKKAIEVLKDEIKILKDKESINMLDRFDEVIKNELPELLKDPNKWDSLIVNRRKPCTYRVFHTFDNGYRLCLHKFDACDKQEAYFHSHPWGAKFKILSGSYKMKIGYSLDRFSKPMELMEMVFTAGCSYEMTNPLIWHNVIPIAQEGTYTVMLNGPDYPDDIMHIETPRTKGKDLEKMPENELIAHLEKFKELLGV